MTSADVRFAHGVASGDPYTDSVMLWTRVTPVAASADPIEVRWEIATSADFAPGSLKGSGNFSTSAARDWTVKVEAAGLSVDTAYYYRFSSGGTVSSIGQTKTLPVGGDPVRLAVFSCANFPAAQQFDAYARAAAINSANPYDAWLQVGDYIYEYGPGGYTAAEAAAGSRSFLPNREIITLDDYRQRYAQYHTDSGLQALRAAAPLIAIWDDHETANDSWKGGAENHQSATEGDWIARRDAALKAYYEWIPIREPGQRQPSDAATPLSPLTQGYRSFRFGDVLALHMLETRLTARDEQLKYPDAAAVQARIGAILADPAQVASYATKAGIAPPTSTAAIPAFANALAPIVTQELVFATVQQAWGNPGRRMIGATQLAWLQQQMATSTAAWQVLGQQVLMRSMAVPAELLLNAGNPALLDKYAAPLQKLATGTPLTSLSAAEQALFAESAKIPYNLDAWDGYGVERETILQTALSLGKRLISLAGDTHNAWAGVLDTMSAGSKPVGTVAGVEFATPGVTSPGLEKYLPGADAYIRAKYPAVDGLDGLFLGYVNGLQYADLNRRGFLDLTVSKEQAVGSFQLLNGIDAASGKALWSSETVVSSSSYALASAAEARPLISWQPGWRELDLSFGLAFDAAGAPTLLDPAAYASVPRDGVQLADVRVQGSAAADRVVVGAGATVEAGAGSDELDNSDSRGGNVLAGGLGGDRFLLRAAGDTVIGGELLANASNLDLPAVVGLVDGQLDVFLIDSSNPAPEGTLGILDFELGVDELLLDGVGPTGSWFTVRQQLQALGITVNAAPQLGVPLIALSLQPGVEVSRDLGSLASDPDGNPLQLVKLEGPAWITTSGTTVKAIAPVGVSDEQLAALTLRLAFSDGQAVVPLAARLTLNAPPSALALANITPSLVENTSTASRIKVADIVITDDALGSNVISLSGADAASFEVIGAELFLKAGTTLNFEAKASYAVTVLVVDPALPGSTPVSAAFALAVNDVNEPPAALALTNITPSLVENTSTASRIKVADIVITDDALGSNVISLSGADAASFEVIGAELFLKAGTTLNIEAKASYAVTVRVVDPALPGSTPVSAAFALAVNDVNEPPAALALTNITPSLVENTSTASRIKVADIVITDDALGSNVISLSGADAASFEVIGAELFLKAGTTLNFEAKASYAVTVRVVDPALTGSTPVSAAFALAVNDVNEPPAALALTNITPSLVENTSTASRIKVADIVITDDALGSNVISLSGADAASFEVIGAELFLKAGTTLNFEAKASYAVTVRVVDPALPGSTPVSAAFALAVNDVNEPPAALALTNITPSLVENTSTASRIKVADIVITDDALGSNVISLSGADAASFEVIGAELFLKAGTTLNFEAKASYAVTVRVVDPALTGSTPVSAAFALAVNDVNEVAGVQANTTIVSVTLPNGDIKPITVRIDDGDLAPGTNLSVISNLGINASGLTSLAELGITPNGTGLDFQLRVDRGTSASVNAILELAAADLLPQLTNPSGARRADRKLLYYAVNTEGAISPLTYDPITGTGARFYDLDNNGSADFFSLSLIDGGYGDKDGLANGVIDDPSVASFVDLTNLRFSNAGSGTVTISDPTNVAPAAVSLRATLSRRPSSSNQVGYVVLNTSEVARADSLLTDLNWLRGRSRTLFSSLENTDVTLPAGSTFDRDIQLINGQSLRFFEVQDASLDQLTSLADRRFRLLTTGNFANGQVDFSSTSGVRFSLNLLPNDPGLNALISQAQGLAPVLDLSPFTPAQSLSGTVAVGREAAFNSVAGFYRILDAAGTVLAADAITRLRPDESGYTAAALRPDNLIGQLGSLSVADNQSASRSFSGVAGGSFLAPFAQVNGNTFFAFGAANTDRISHFRSLGNNLFGFEDIVGGGDTDYDDMVIGFNFSNVV